MVKKSIGVLLKERRTKLDWGLDKAEKTTAIKKIYISALETENYAIFPGPFYVRAYLKQYAEKLELDVEAILEAYDHKEPVEVEGPFEDTGNYRFIRPDERIPLPSDEDDEEAKTWLQRYLPMVALSSIAIIILIAVGVMVFFNFPKSTSVSSNDYSLSSSSVSSSSSSSSASSTSLSLSADGKSLQIVTNESSVDMGFTLNANVEAATASASGTVTQSVSLSSTSQKSAEFKLENKATTSILTVSDIKAMTITINGQTLDISKLDQPSNVITLQISYNSGTSTSSSSSSASSSSSN
ncbi:MAG: helix-turn-helix domain-containing protein [Streptococcaceae bacterium]|jgi:cytoskeletal protein RodZ|nr:helix-turn-helix domain-containing protein [Streptococcaceae bacterium]